MGKTGKWAGAAVAGLAGLSRPVFRVGLAWLAVAGMAAAEGPEVKVGPNVESLTFSSDMRLRDEYFNYGDSKQDPHFVGAGTSKTVIPTDYNRIRLRYRLYANAKLQDDCSVVAAIGTGVGQQVSQNQTFGSMDQQAQLWLDRAYGMWAPTFGDLGVTLVGGKLATPVWQLATSEILYKPDLTPYGFGESANYQVEDMANVFVNLFQHIYDNYKGSNTFGIGHHDMDPTEMVTQLGVEVPLPMSTRLKVAAADHFWRFLNDRATINDSPFATLQTGNTRSSATLLDAYNVGEVTGQFSFWLPNVVTDTNFPVNLMGTVIKNFAARPSDYQGWIAGQYYNGQKKVTFIGTSADAYEIGAVFGKAAAANTFELQAFYRRAGWDSTVADIVDSDFGGGGLNRKGNIVRAVYSVNGCVFLQVTAFQTWILNQDYDVVYVPMRNINQPNKVNSIQCDVNFKF